MRHEKNQQNPVKNFGLRPDIRIPDSVKKLEPRTIGTQTTRVPYTLRSGMTVTELVNM